MHGTPFKVMLLCAAEGSQPTGLPGCVAGLQDFPHGHTPASGG